jgi:hypothetical protein
MMIGGRLPDRNATLLNRLTTGSQDQGMKSELGFSQDLTRGLAAVRALCFQPCQHQSGDFGDHDVSGWLGCGAVLQVGASAVFRQHRRGARGWIS